MLPRGSSALGMRQGTWGRGDGSCGYRGKTPGRKYCRVYIDTGALGLLSGKCGSKNFKVPSTWLRLGLREAAWMRNSACGFCLLWPLPTWDQASDLNKRALEGTGPQHSNAASQLFPCPLLENPGGRRPLWRELGDMLLCLFTAFGGQLSQRCWHHVN